MMYYALDRRWLAQMFDFLLSIPREQIAQLAIDHSLSLI